MRTYRLELENDFHKELKDICYFSNVTMKCFILEALKEKMAKAQKK